MLTGIGRFKVCEGELIDSSYQLQEAQKQLKVEKEALAAAEEKIQKLERRLIFVTKARVGR